MFKITIDKRYVTFEVDPKKNPVAVNFMKDGNGLEQVFVHLGENPGGYKYFIDMSEYIGQTLECEITDCPSEWKRMPEGAWSPSADELEALRRFVRVEDDFEDVPHYSEPLRPLVHFTTLRGWSNDPNGCIYYDGKYHLYYQHCPGAPYGMWDNNHWGHAVSEDLFAWQELEPVLRWPHRASGTGFINRENGKVCIASDYLFFESDDGGYHYKYFGQNTAGCGDPKVLYHEETGKYIAITLRDITSYSFSSSKDLVEWEHESDIEQFRECPEMVKYTIDGTNEEKWVLNGGDGAYIIGWFDGHRFIPDEIEDDRLDKYFHAHEATRDFKHKYNGVFVNTSIKDSWDRFSAYAFQQFDNAPDGRHIRIAWYAVGYERRGMPFTQAMTLPQELKLRYTPFGLRVCTLPVEEIKRYYGECRSASGSDTEVEFADGRAFDVEVSFDVGATLRLGIYDIRYDAARNMLCIHPDGEDEFELPFIATDGKVKLRAVFDVLMCEFFLGEGEVYCPVKPEYVADGLKVVISDGNGCIEAHRLERSMK